ncbi:MFS transporter [Brevundimonas sp. CEF1]|uniref:MFS transporter n=1 Tax=Brevundimonas sp. CEF1 TaxID=3442642 RepID=UPI003F512873
MDQRPLASPPVADYGDEGSPFYRKVLLTAVLGNVVEWYDNALYGILAVFLARTFFPESDPTAALLATYVGLIAAYAIRPVGGVLMGRLSDVRGHRFTLMLTIGLMTGGTLLIGLLPGYSAVGLAAPALLMLCRLIQGVGASGEYTVAANFILEHGPRRKRQYLAGWSVGSTSVGPLIASLVAVALTSALSPEAFESWGWRILFLLSAPMGLVTLFIRRHAPDLPRIQKVLDHAAEVSPPSRPFVEAVRGHWREMAQVIALGAGQRIGTFCISTYFVTALIGAGFGETRAIFASILAYLIGPPAAILGGLIADRVGGRIVLIVGFAAFTLLTVPTFLVIGTSLGLTLAAVLGFTFVNNFVGAPLTHAYVMTFSPEVRGTASALNYNIGTTLIGSTAPLVAAALFARTGSNLSFAWYMTAACVLSLAVAVFAYPQKAKA